MKQHVNSANNKASMNRANCGPIQMAPPTPNSVTPVQEVINQLVNTVDLLHRELNALDVRLMPVLTTSAQIDATSSSGLETSHVLSQLNELTNRVGAAVHIVVGLQGNLQI